VAQLVAEDREELVLGPVGLLGGEPRGALLLGELPLGQIARHLREADQLAAAIAHRADHDVRPEPGPVLAHAPALVLEPALARGDLELALARPGRRLVWGIERGEVAADDLV